MRHCWLYFLVWTCVGAALANQEHSDQDTERGPRALAPKLAREPQLWSVATEPRTKEDLFIFAGPRLESINWVEPAHRIYVDRSFRLDPSIAHDFTLLARDVERIVRSMFDGAAPPVNKPIVCWIGAPLPLTDSTSIPQAICIRIALTKQDLKERNYCRFAYQLSHEMGHVYLDPRRSNGLIETLADAIAYQTLARLSHLWKSKMGDHDEIKSYAPRFLTYREMKTAEKMKVLPPEVLAQLQQGHTASVKAYLEQHTQELDESPYTERGLALRGLAATICPEERSWGPFFGIAGLTDPSPSQDARYREGLRTQIERAPHSVREVLTAIGRH